MESWIFLSLILAISYLGKNSALMFASIFVMFIKAIPFMSDKLFPYFQAKGMNLGVTIISIAILIPIATEKIKFVDLVNTMKSPAGWIAIFFGIAVAILSKNGVNLLSTSPQATVALVLGTIIGVVFLKGVAAGPIIAAGMTYYVITILNLKF